MLHHPARLRRRTLLGGASAAGALALTGCSDDDPEPDTAGTDRVTYLTGFNKAPHDAFAWVGRELGIFKDHGIDITIELGQDMANAAPLVAGSAQFAKVDFTLMVIQAGSGNVTDLRALALLEQNSLAGIVAPEDSGIVIPQDIEDKRVGVFANSTQELLLPAYCEQAEVSYDLVEVVPTDAATLFSSLAAGDVDALATFVIQQGVIEAIIGRPTITIPYREYLPDLFGTCIVATEDLTNQNPDLCVRFREGVVEAMHEALADPEGAMVMMAEGDPAVEIEPGVGQIELMQPLVTASGEDAIGQIDEDRVARGIAVLQANGLFGAGLTPDDILVPDVSLLA